MVTLEKDEDEEDECGDKYSNGNLFFFGARMSSKLCVPFLTSLSRSKFEKKITYIYICWSICYFNKL